jgi:dsDNA-binding SOS-regulon protein
MAVIAVWQCDRDGSMFEDKKQAEEHDKFLELAANITTLIEQEIPNINEEHSEAIGLLLARRREQLAKACRGKPEELLEEPPTSEAPTNLSTLQPKVAVAQAANA